MDINVKLHGGLLVCKVKSVELVDQDSTSPQVLISVDDSSSLYSSLVGLVKIETLGEARLKVQWEMVKRISNPVKDEIYYNAERRCDLNKLQQATSTL